jgi:hypothetical protein
MNLDSRRLRDNRLDLERTANRLALRYGENDPAAVQFRRLARRAKWREWAVAMGWALAFGCWAALSVAIALAIAG